MAKTAVGKVAELAAEEQTHTLIQKAVGQLEDFASRIGQAATAGSRRKYVLASLTALVIAGQAAAAIRTSLAARPKAAAAKRTPARKRSKKITSAKRRAR